MSADEITYVLAEAEAGNPTAVDQLLPMVYDELRRVAAIKLSRERRNQTLQATALVHEAWLRIGGDSDKQWAGRTYYFAAAAEAMRRILIERARRKISAIKAGFENREELSESRIVVDATPTELLAVHEALSLLEKQDTQAAELVKLRYFVGMPMPQAADSLGLSLRSAERLWTFAKVFLKNKMQT